MIVLNYRLFCVASWLASRNLNSLAVVFVLALSTSAYAEEMTLGVVTTERLNLRALPNAQGAVVAELPRGTRLVLFSNRIGEWREVGTLINDQTKTGWVHEKFIVEVPRHAPSSQPPRSPAPVQVRSPFAISSSDLDCKEDLLGEGYSRCEYTIRVEYHGDTDVDGTFSVNCDVEARLEHRNDILPTRRSFDGYGTLYVSSGYGRTTVDVTLRPSFSLEPLVAVKVTDTQCRYDR